LRAPRAGHQEIEQRDGDETAAEAKGRHAESMPHRKSQSLIRTPPQR
jgi:hypothetical protein